MSKIRQGAVVLGSTSVALRPLSFEREASHVANLQADADLHTFQTNHRDAVPEMRCADAARIDRATKRQLQFADL
jgi:hypothetical protein